MRLRVSTLFIGVLMAFVLLLTEQGYLKSYLALTSERGALDEPGKRRKPKKTFSVENVLKNSRLEKQVLYIVRHGDRWDYYAQKKLNISEGSEVSEQ